MAQGFQLIDKGCEFTKQILSKMRNYFVDFVRK